MILKNIKIFRLLPLLTSFFWVIFAVSNLAWLGQISSAEAASETKPKLHFPQTVYDFGAVSQGTVVEHDFVIENLGTQELELKKIHTSCGCTAAVLENDKIPAGGRTAIKVQFDTNGFRGFKVKTVRVYTNDPESVSAVLTIKGSIQAETEISPAALNFGNVNRGDSQTLSVVVKSKEPDFKISSIVPRTDQVSVESSAIPEGTKLEITLKKGLPVGVVRTRIALRTNSKKTPLLNIPVFANIKGDLGISESVISFGLVDGPLETELSKEVTISNYSENEIKILSAASDHPKIQAEISELVPGKKYSIKVKLAPGVTGAIRSRVTIETDHPENDQRELFLPVYAIISRGPVTPKL